jgi:hypothetical protein
MTCMALSFDRVFAWSHDRRWTSPVTWPAWLEAMINDENNPPFNLLGSKPWSEMNIICHLTCSARSLVCQQGRHVESVGIKPWSGMMNTHHISCLARSLVCHQGQHLKPIGIKPWSRIKITRHIICWLEAVTGDKDLPSHRLLGPKPCVPSRATHETYTPWILLICREKRLEEMCRWMGRTPHVLLVIESVQLNFSMPED